MADGSPFDDLPLRCVGCNRELKTGDLYIEDTPSGFIDEAADSDVDGLLAGIFGGAGGKVVFCEDCTDTTREGKYHFVRLRGDDE